MGADAVAAVTGAIDFTTIIVGNGAVGAAVGLVKVSKVGLQMLLSAIRS